MATSDNKTADTDEKIFIGKGEQTAWLRSRLPIGMALSPERPEPARPSRCR